MYELKKIWKNYLRVNFSGPGPRLIKKEFKVKAHRTRPTAAACGRNRSYSILHHQWQTESGLTRRPAARRITVLYLKTVCPRGLFKMDTEKLIGLVKSNVFLYDVGHNDYKNVVKKAEAWREIASLSFEHIRLLQFVTTFEI